MACSCPSPLAHLAAFTLVFISAGLLAARLTYRLAWPPGAGRAGVAP